MARPKKNHVADCVDVVVEDDRWNDMLDSLSQTAGQAVLTHLGYDPKDFEICVMGCDDARIADLNADFRDKPTPTNVLSWPSEERGAEVEGGNPIPVSADPTGMPFELGDIAIAFDTCEREAKAADKPFDAHCLHLLVHGMLHLLGYDHICDPDAALMEGLEVEILEHLGQPNPYILNEG